MNFGIWGKTVIVSRTRTLRLVAAVVLALGVSQAAMSTAQAAIVNAPDKTASFNGQVNAVAYLGGVVYVGGNFTAAIQNGTSIARNHVAAIDETTGNVLPWNPNASGDVNALAVTPGAVYLGGAFGRVGGAVHTNIASVSPGGTGTVNAGFTASATSGNVKALTVSGSAVYAGGTFQLANGQSKRYLAAFNGQTGALLTAFNAVPNNTVRALYAANNMIYVGGEFSTMDGFWRGRYLAAVNPTNGTVPTTYQSPIGYRVMGLAVTSTTIYAAADGSGGHLVAAQLNGALRWIVTADGGFQAVTVLGSTIYAGGHMTNVCNSARTGDHGACLDGSVVRQKLLAVDTNGNLLPWAPQANSNLGAFSMSSDPATGRIAVGGQFTKFNFSKISQPYFAQFG